MRIKHACAALHHWMGKGSSRPFNELGFGLILWRRHLMQSPYFSQYAEPVWELAQCLSGQWDYVLCIPAYKETTELLKRLSALPCSSRVLVILNINAPVDAGEAALTSNQELMAACQALPLLQQLSAFSALYELNAHHQLLLLDYTAAERRLPKDGGVGLARKLTCDLGAALVLNKTIGSPWLFCSDGDVELPPGYFEASDQWQSAQNAALLFPFEHFSADNKTLDKAQRLYDFTLYYYVSALRWAKSPYAFQSIGSTMAIHAHAYTKVRGFPKRAAAEDFYMLNKLAKVGNIVSLPSPSIRIATRTSDRVPFGTGAAISTLLNMENPLQNYRYYHPRCFHYLRWWLGVLPELFGKVDWHSELENTEHSTCNATVLIAVLEELGINKALNHGIAQNLDAAKFRKHMHDWFDGFRTLRFIHLVRNSCFPSLELASPILQEFVELATPELLPAWHTLTLELRE